MNKKIFTLFIILLFTFSLVSGSVTDGKPSVQTKQEKYEEVGKTLIYYIISGFKAMAVGGSGGYNVVDILLQKSMIMLRNAKEKGKVDSVFYRRYKRILEVLKLTIMDAKFDKESILGDHISRVTQDFIYDITGEIKEIDKLKRGVGLISEAVSEELLNLHIYLDTKENRKGLINKLSQVPPPPPPSAKKKKKELRSIPGDRRSVQAEAACLFFLIITVFINLLFNSSYN